MENKQWDEATVPTGGPVGYRQQRLPLSLQILNPRQKFPFRCFPHHHFLNHLSKYRFKWRPFEALATTYKKEATTVCPDGKNAQSCVVCWSLSAASFFWLPAISFPLFPSHKNKQCPFSPCQASKLLLGKVSLAGECCRLHYPLEELAPWCQFWPGPTAVQATS